jgi:hypothetical protein
MRAPTVSVLTSEEAGLDLLMDRMVSYDTVALTLNMTVCHFDMDPHNFSKFCLY